MGNIESKKLKTIERLINSYDERIFDKINEFLDEEGQSNMYSVPDEHYSLLKEDHEKYLRGELETSSWENVEARLRKKYDL